MRGIRGLAAALLLALAAALTSSAAANQPRQLNCPPSIISEVPVSCSDSGTVLAASNATYSFLIEEGDADEFDLVVALHTQSGDADLVVSTPGGQDLISMHGSGEDVVFIPRSRVLPGEYVVNVLGSSDQSSFRLVVEKFARQRQLADEDRAALTQVLYSPCCSRPGSCSSLRSGLAADAPEDDLCASGQNLCDVNGHLLHLAIVNEYLDCPFPSALAALGRLTMLDLTMNDLTGSMEADVAPVVAQLPGLQNLLLSHNRLGGSLTCDLMGPALAELELAANQVEGTIPPCLLASPTIQELYLSNNRLIGSLPGPPADSKLLIISAHSMGLSGSIPDVSRLPQLQALQLHNNRLTGSLPHMPPAMRNIHLEYNNLSGSIPEQWGSLEGLEVLRLRHNSLTGSVPAGLALQSGLELMLLSDNGLSGALPGDWQTPQLARLDVQGNNFTGPLPAALGALPALTVLQAHSNQLSGGLQEFAAQAVAAAGAPSPLQVLTLHGNGLSGGVPPELQQLPLLEGGYSLLDGVAVPATLDLADNQLSGPFPTWAVQALAASNVVIDMAGNRLACPEEEIVIGTALSENRLLGLDCTDAGGKVRQVAQLVRFDPSHKQEAGPPAAAPAPAPKQPQPPAAAPAAAPEQQREAAAPVPAAAQQPSAAEGPSSASPRDAGASDGTSGGGGGIPGWGIALAVVGSVAVAGAALVAAPRLLARLQELRARRYESYNEPDSPAGAHTALAASKQQAVALAELHAKRQSLKALSHPGLASGGGGGGSGSGFGGLAGLEAGAAAGATGGSASPSAAAEAGGYQPFSIGTKVHTDEGPDMV